MGFGLLNQICKLVIAVELVGAIPELRHGNNVVLLQAGCLCRAPIEDRQHDQPRGCTGGQVAIESNPVIGRGSFRLQRFIAFDDLSRHGGNRQTVLSLVRTHGELLDALGDRLTGRGRRHGLILGDQTLFIVGEGRRR